MGGGYWTSQDWDGYKSSRKSRGMASVDHHDVKQVFTASSMPDGMDPLGIKYRECVASEDHPNPTPIIVALDQTGSMGSVIHTCLKQLNEFIVQLYDKAPVESPQLCFMAVGDMANGERAPLQVTQFESDVRIAEQLEKMYIEGNGGGNNSESYIAPWYFASTKTKLDCANTGKKGFLFTIGDEECTPVLTSQEIRKYIDAEYTGTDMTPEDILRLVTKHYYVFHVVVEEGSHCRYYKENTYKSWNNILGQKVIALDNVEHLTEVLIATLQMYGANMSKDQVVKDWDGSTAVATISKAIANLDDNNSNTSGLVSL